MVLGKTERDRKGSKIMAYGKEVQVEHGLIAKNNRGEFYRIARVVPDGGKLESVDMRLMYTDDNGELRHTKKGIRVNSENIVEFLTVAIEALSDEERDELFDILEGMGLI